MKDWLERRLSLMMTLRLAGGAGQSRRSQFLCVLQAVHGTGKGVGSPALWVGKEMMEGRVKAKAKPGCVCGACSLLRTGISMHTQGQCFSEGE